MPTRTMPASSERTGTPWRRSHSSRAARSTTRELLSGDDVDAGMVAIVLAQLADFFASGYRDGGGALERTMREMIADAAESDPGR